MTVIISSKLGKIAAEAEGKASLVVRKTSLDVAAGAARRSRVDTGAMRGGWTPKMNNATSATVRNSQKYALHNEYGTTKMSAQPMARPAAEEARGPFMRAMGRIFT